MKFIFICGLPGSGKSHLGKRLERCLDALLLDDEVSLATLKAKYRNDTVIFADPSLCSVGVRMLAERNIRKNHPGCEIEWIFFENDPVKCWNNVVSRNDDCLRQHMIREMSLDYNIPAGMRTLPVFNCTKNIVLRK